MDIEPIIDGLQVSAIGMGMTSVVLVLLALSVRAMAIFDAYMKRREVAGAANVDEEVSEPTATGSEIVEKSVSDGPARAAAIAVALALSQQATIGSTVSTSVAERSERTAISDTWLSEGRARQRANRGVAQAGGVRR